jgi:hypothetical protein
MGKIASKPIEPPSQTPARLAIAAAAILMACSPMYFFIPSDTTDPGFVIVRAALAPAAGLALEFLGEALISLVGVTLNKIWRWVFRASAVLAGLVVYIVFIS